MPETIDFEAPSIPELIEQMKAEAESLDVGDFAKDQEERNLHRYLRRRSQIEAERDRVKELTKAMIASMDSQIAALDYLFMKPAEDTARRLLDGKKVKSIKTPFGTVGFRTNPARLEIIDETKVPWEFVKMSPSIEKAKLNEHFKNTGELPDGCKLTDAEEKFFVK